MSIFLDESCQVLAQNQFSSTCNLTTLAVILEYLIEKSFIFRYEDIYAPPPPTNQRYINAVVNTEFLFRMKKPIKTLVKT